MPAFQLNVVQDLETLSFNLKPQLKDFLGFIGDTISEFATICHRSLRPVKYVKLTSFIQEATRVVSVQDLDPLQLKSVLEMSEDYIYSVQQIKWGLQYAYERA